MIIKTDGLIRPSDLVDFGGVYEFYADGIACVQDRRDNFRTVFYVWEETADAGDRGVVPRIIAKVTRPKSSILAGDKGVIAQMLAMQQRKMLHA